MDSDRSHKAWTNKHVSLYIDQQISCHHTIPAEIAEKIVEKIKLQQEFREAHYDFRSFFEVFLYSVQENGWGVTVDALYMYNILCHL